MRRLPFLFVFLSLVLFVPTAAARIGHIVPDGSGDAPTLQAGIDSAAAGDTVEAAPGFYPESKIALKSGIVFRSETAEAACCTIAARFTGRVLQCVGVDSNTVIEGFTITTGWTSTAATWPQSCGAGLYLENSSPVVRNCAFKDNQAGDMGGGVFCHNGSSPTITDVVFYRNQSAGNGAGLVWHTDSAPIVRRCLFESNDAGARGGGLAALCTARPVTDCEFRDNKAQEGGAAYVTGVCSLYVSGCDFIENRGRFVGGAVEVKNGAFASIDSCRFLDNSSMDDGGAVRAEFGSSASIRNSAFEGNTSDDRGGGAIFTWGGSHRIESCTFTTNKNFWNVYGGAVELRDNDEAILGGCTFIDNVGQGDGGAVYARGFSPEIDSCSFLGNYAPEGGAIYFHNCPAPVVKGCTFDGNSGLRGAALYFHGFSGIVGGSVDSCTFHGNQASQHGSAVYCRKAAPSVARSILASGLSSEAVYCEDDSSSVALSCSDLFGNEGGDFAGCVAGQEGLNGNFSADPYFCDAGSGDFTLDAASPCLPGNYPDGATCGRIGAYDQGCDVVTEVAGSAEEIPAGPFLAGNMPNPFNPSTLLRFGIPAARDLTLTIHDVSGRLVAVLARGPSEAGTFEAVWDGRDSHGRGVPSGVYFARLRAGEFTATRKLVLLR